MNFKFYRSTEPTATTIISAANMEEKLVYSSGWNTATITFDITAAMNMVETVCDRALLTQTWTGRGDYFPPVIHLPKGQVDSITSLKYIAEGATSFTEMTVNVDYIVELEGDKARIYPPSTGWPNVNTDREGVVEVIYSAGYGAAASNIPGWAKSAMTMIAGDLNTNGSIKSQMAVDKILWMNKMFFDYCINN